MGDGERQRPASAEPAGRRQRGPWTAVIVVAGVAALLVVAAAVTVARWAGQEEEAVEPGAPEREPDPPADEEGPPAADEEPAPPAAEPAPEVVTEDHDGITLAMSPGDATALQLSNDRLWEEPEVSGASVALATVDHLVDPGYAEWQVEAVAPGTSEVTAHGSPNCGDEAACPPRTVTVTFAVAATTS